MTKTRIVAAAIRYKTPLAFKSMVVMVERPGRHHDVIHSLHGTTGYSTHDEEQGFLTSNGYFVDRAIAFDIATAAGQIAVKHGNPNQLYSEDLW